MHFIELYKLCASKDTTKKVKRQLQNVRKYLQVISYKGLISRKGKTFEKTIFQRKYGNNHLACEKMSTSLFIRNMQIKTTKPLHTH